MRPKKRKCVDNRAMFNTTPIFQFGRYSVPLTRPLVMGILNVTPDSFSDGAQHQGLEAAVARGIAMAAEGADIIDVGGESTRPGATPVALEVELARVIPVIQALAAQLQKPISIDTSKPEVMRAAVGAGASLINDVYALRQPGALAAAAALKVPVVLMHMLGEPGTMQSDPYYQDVVEEVARFLTERILACQFAGIDKKQILIDPGFGFGKTLEHNLALLANIARFTELECPVAVGLSRKGMIGALTGQKSPEARAAGSLAAALIAAQRGAQIVRVHDVKQTVDALAVLNAVPAARVIRKGPEQDLAALFA